MDDSLRLSRKEREKLLRRQDILYAAASLFAHKGFNNTTLEEISVKSEFGIGTIYNYFQNKEEIFRSILESVLEANLEIIEDCSKNSENFISFITLYAFKIMDFFAAHRDALLLLVSYYTGIGERPVHMKLDAFEPKACRLDDIFNTQISTGIKNNEIRELPQENLHFLIHSILFPYITSLVKTGKLDQSNIKEHAEFIIDVLFNGILKK